jgi:hypothetical protein
MTMPNAHPVVDFPDDVENALILLRCCLSDLRIEIEPAYDDMLRSMIEQHLDQTKFRVATDEQLQFAHRQAAEAEHTFQRAHQRMLGRLAAGVSKTRVADGDDLPWL